MEAGGPCSEPGSRIPETQSKSAVQGLLIQMRCWVCSAAASPVGGGWASSAAGNGRGGGSGDASPATAAMVPLMSRREERNAPALTVGPRGLSSRGSSPGIGGVSPGAAPPGSKGALSSPGSRKASLVVPGAQEFTLPDLQQATNSFAQENRVAEGPLGSSYRADFAQGRVSGCCADMPPGTGSAEVLK